MAKFVIIITKMGIIKKLDIREFRRMGRLAKGTIGIKLNDGDEVVAITSVEE